ncbi:MAG TPA: DUF1501 domain-containing protein [Burkholderiales bacterium]|nr:DUF1501 domain-containing protein [Burkholderiales bacterium]HUK05354.1 DUF1501 domain-containing protein [Burkholderiales bacterium]
MDRRRFVRAGAGAALALAGARVWAAPAAGSTKLLVVMLRGAYDGASLLVPYSSDFYYRARPGIAVPRPGAGDGAAIRLDADWALNPAVRDTLLPLYAKKQAAFVPFSGSGDTSRSHFQAQDLMEMGQGGAGPLDYSSGFLNRLVQALGSDPRAGGVAFTNNLTLAFKGPVPVPNVSLRGGARAPLPQGEGERIAAMYEGTPLASVAAAGIETRREVSQQLMTEMAESARGAGPARAFESQARVVGRLMASKSSYSIGFVDVGGWDTHVNQGAAQGALANNLEGLAAGIAAFASEMGALWPGTAVVVLSEFGRTARENGNRGTDHGHGNTLWVLGGGVAGGRVAGEQVPVDERHLYQDRDFPVLNDYRSVLAHLFARMYGLDGARIERVLPGAKARNYGLV